MRLCELRGRLSGRIHAADVAGLSRMAQGERGDGMKAMLWALALGDDIRVARNALWVFTHLDRADMGWLAARQQALIDRAMKVGDVTSRRLLLALLECQDFAPEDISTGFLDFCLDRMLLDSEPVGVRALCIKLAYRMCRHYPELLDELRRTLDMIPAGESSAALRACRRNVLRLCRDPRD